MCGINCIYRPEGCAPDDVQRVQTMNRALAYRGPDGEGLHRDDQIVLGMQRLAIIDVSGGNQPLFNEQRTLALVCNGEIYNHVELRDQLRKRGHVFATGSDCETLLHLYEEHGLDFLSEVRGMFAFAIWDATEKRLIAGRDRLGQRPLYFSRTGRGIALSSELKTLVAAGFATDAVDSRVLCDTLRLTYPLDPRQTLARDVTRVLPGTILVAGQNGISEHEYWAPSRIAVREGKTARDAARTLAESVQVHLRSDVPVAILLSGGLDSAAIASYAAERGANFACITAGYAGRHSCDERDAARVSAAQVGLPLTQIELDEHSFSDLVPRIAERCDEPAVDIASVSQWALYSACREHGFKVVLSGLGGDELFFGYPFWNAVGRALAARPPNVDRWVREGGILSRALATLPVRTHPWLLSGRSGFLAHPTVREHGSILRRLGFADDSFDARLTAFGDGLPRGPRAVYRILQTTYLPNNGLQLADKLGMGNSVEVRVPFVDHLLFECLEAIPIYERLDGRTSKLLLRRILRGRIPEVLRIGAKRGFAPPSTFVRRAIETHLPRALESTLVREHFNVDTLRAAAKERPFDWFLFGVVAASLSHESWKKDRPIQEALS